MILLLHIVVSLSGVLAATAGYLLSSRRSLLTSKVLAVLTLASGALLTIQSSANLVKACSVGLAYFSVVLYLNYQAKKRLAAQ